MSPLCDSASRSADSAAARVMNKNHMFDATEIFRTLSQHKKGTSPLLWKDFESHG